MHPILLNLGPIPIHTYGFLIAVGFLVALQVIKRLASKEKLPIEKTLDLAFWGLAVGFVGARLLFILTRLDTFIADPISIFKVWEGGLVFFGGPILAVPFVVWYIRKHKLNLWKTIDVFAPALVIAHAFGRLGCFSAGCCYGRPTGNNWGVKFYSDLVEKEFQGINLHPTQLYESFSLLILFFGLLWIQRHKKFDGQTALSYFMVYPIIRSIVEIFRGDILRGFIIEPYLSTSQFISLLVFIGASVALFYRLKKIKD